MFTCHVFDAFDLFHVLILLCLKAARLGGGKHFSSCHVKWNGKLEEFFAREARELYKYHFLVCFAAIIILLKPVVVVGKRGIYEGEKSVS